MGTDQKTVGVLIRDFRKSDLDDLLRLLPICNAEEFKASGFDPDNIRSLVNRMYGWSGKFLLGLMRLFGKNPIKFFVAEADGKLVGTTIVQEREKAGMVSVVMVDPDYRRNGIATRLMKTALEYIHARGKSRAVLGALSTNTPAIDMYVKLGFKVFEHAAYFVGEADSLLSPPDASEVSIRPFRNGDLEKVYALVVASEDAVRLKMYDFKKSNLKRSFLERLLRSASTLQFVAVYNSRIIGDAEASYTTPNEAGRIGFVHVNVEGRRLGIEKLLVNKTRNEVQKAGVKRFRITVPTTQPELVETVKALGFKEAFVVDGMSAEFGSVDFSSRRI